MPGVAVEIAPQHQPVILPLVEGVGRAVRTDETAAVADEIHQGPLGGFVEGEFAGGVEEHRVEIHQLDGMEHARVLADDHLQPRVGVRPEPQAGIHIAVGPGRPAASNRMGEAVGLNVDQHLGWFLLSFLERGLRNSGKGEEGEKKGRQADGILSCRHECPPHRLRGGGRPVGDSWDFHFSGHRLGFDAGSPRSQPAAGGRRGRRRPPGGGAAVPHHQPPEPRERRPGPLP